MEPIKTEDDLKRVLKFLDEQGFGYISDYELHRKKIDHIISKNNILGIKYDDKLKERLRSLKDYDEVEKEAKLYFSKFNVDDKISEHIKTFSLYSDDSCGTPYMRPDPNAIIEWVNFKNKYNLKDEYGAGNPVFYYNLDKNYLKIYYGSYKDWEFKELYKLIFDEDSLPNLNSKKVGLWQNLGKIEIKFFQKGGANIKGDLKKLKGYYYTYLKNEMSRNSIIKYNGKVENIIKDKKYI